MRKANSRFNGELPICSAESAAEQVSDDATIGISGFGSVGYPKLIPEALAASDRDRSLTIISGGSVGEEVDKKMVEAGVIARRYPYQATREARKAVNDGEIEFHDTHISSLGDDAMFGYFGNIDLAIVEAIAVGKDWLIPSTSIGHSPSYVRAADRLLVEVNESQPLELQQVHDIYEREDPPNREPIPLSDPADTIGSTFLRFPEEKLLGVVKTDRRDSPYTFRNQTQADNSIADHLTAFLSEEIGTNSIFQDQVNLQFGVGSLGNALMSSLKDLELEDRDINYYGEVIQDGLLDMIDSGELETASATSLALSREGQEYFFDNIERYADEITLRPADISNNPAIIDQLGLIGINSALEVDIFGHANSTHVKGTRIINGLGGSGDFNRHCSIPIIALPSVTKDGETSRIVPFASHVDHTEHDFSILVTEHGFADLRGLSPRERANEIIENCAHPSFKNQLRAYLESGCMNGGHIPHDLSEAVSWFE